MINTRDYLVIKEGPKILFAKFDDIDKNTIKKSDLSIEFLNQSNTVTFKVVDTQCLSSTITKQDFKLCVVEATDICIAEKKEKRPNTIQITFQNAAMIWDLDEHKEVSYISKLEEFASSKQFVTTGFKPYVF